VTSKLDDTEGRRRRWGGRIKGESNLGKGR